MTDGHTDHGKWSQSGVPHKGWRCIGVEDLEEPSRLCSMCESIEIRYVHLMEHPDYPETLGVGCVCAENMEQDFIGPRLREKRLRTKAQRRKTWVKRRWHTSEKGNLYLNTEGFNLTVFKMPDRERECWRLKVTHRASERAQLGKRQYHSEEAAKIAALDALFWARERLVD